MYKNIAKFSELISFDTATISASYQLVGTIEFPIVEITFKNVSDGDLIVSTDGDNDMIYLPAQSYSDKDVRTNAPYNSDLMFPAFTNIYVKQGSVVSTAGSLYVECIIATQ